MSNKDQLVVVIDSNLKQSFKIACIKNKENMTDAIREMIVNYVSRTDSKDNKKDEIF